MKLISKLIIWLTLALAATHLQAQSSKDERDKDGFIRLISLVSPGEGNTFFKIDNKIAWEPGYSLGQRGGRSRLKEGTHTFVVSKKGCLRAEEKIQVVRGETQTIVAYAEPVLNDLNEVEAWQIKIARLRQHEPEKGILATIVSFCADKEVSTEVHEIISNKKQMLSLQKLRSKRVPLGRSRVAADIKVDGEKVCTVKTKGKGNYVVMIYETGERKKEAIWFYDPKFLASS